MLPVKHSINLYLPQFRPPQLSREIVLLLKVCSITFIGLVVLSIVLFVFKIYSSGQLVQLKEEQKQLNNELTILISQFPNLSIDRDLQDNIEREKKLLTKKNRVISFLRQDSINARSSFTPLIEQLSQQNVSGIWLSKVEIINQGKDIQLTGFAKTPEKVSLYMTMLGTKDAYRGRTFKQINIIKGNAPWNEFFLSTKKKRSDDASRLQEPVLGRGL